MPLAPNQPEKAVYWSVDDFRKQHQASAARAASRQTGPDGPNLFPHMTYRTHGWVSVYRPTSIMTRPLPAELHMGVTNSEHWVKDVEPSGPDAGFTYMLFKIQAGLYPWELTNREF